MNILFLHIICVASVAASNRKGIPVPGAATLDHVLSHALNQTDYTGAIFDYLRGDNARRSGQLHFGVLDYDNVKQIINTIKERYNADSRRYSKQEAYHEYPETNAIKETALDMMKQSIYAAKFRMNDTRRFRKLYKNNPSFYIAMYYGALLQVSIKMETLFTIMKKLGKYTHFLWFLVIYEKVLAANVDAHDMVDRIFDLHKKYLRQARGEVVVLAPTIPTPSIPTNRTRRHRTRTRPSVITPGFDEGFMSPGHGHGPEYADETKRPDYDHAPARPTEIEDYHTEEEKHETVTKAMVTSKVTKEEADGNNTDVKQEDMPPADDNKTGGDQGGGEDLPKPTPADNEQQAVDDQPADNKITAENTEPPGKEPSDEKEQKDDASTAILRGQPGDFNYY